MHTQIDLRGFIPAFIDITEAKLNAMKALDRLIPEPGAIYLLDKGYLDFSRLWKFEQCKAFFVTRTKSNTRFKRLYSKPVDKSSGLKCD